MSISLKIITPHGIYKELETSILNVQTVDGDRGILPNHMPLVTSLKIGKMTTEEPQGRETYAVSGGILYFNENEAKLLTDAIENSKEIDVARAEAAKARAEERLSKNDENVDFKRASVALAKALNRLSVSSY